MPFRASTAIVGESVADMFVTEIIKEQTYEVVERSAQIDKVLSRKRGGAGDFDQFRAAEMGSMLGADAVIIGTVDEYSMMPSKDMHFAVVGINARMIDCKSGKILWSIDLAQRGASTSVTVPEHARAVVRAMVEALRAELAKPMEAY